VLWGVRIFGRAGGLKRLWVCAEFG
jgi:hypothetical protein